MRIITVELINNNALRLLEDLEKLNIIRILDNKTEEKNKLSSRIRGAITKDRANELNEQLNQMRNEWEDRNS